jgi:hypothetical protein
MISGINLGHLGADLSILFLRGGCLPLKTKFFLLLCAQCQISGTLNGPGSMQLRGLSKFGFIIYMANVGKGVLLLEESEYGVGFLLSGSYVFNAIMIPFLITERT